MQERKVQAVVFDMDGVLLDSEWLYIQKYAEFLTISGYPAKPEEMMFHAGRGPGYFYPRIKEMFGIPWDKDTYVEKAYGYVVAQEYDFLSVRSPGLLPLLQHLKASGYPLAIATTSFRKKVNAVLKACEIREYFPIVVTHEEGSALRSKPAPDLYLEAAKQLGAAPAACLAVEDSTTGLAAAVAAGMITVGKEDARYGFDLSAADFHITQLGELAGLIRRLNGEGPA